MVTADPRPERAEAARRNLDAAGLGAFAEVRCGDPLDMLDDVPGPVDVLAIDGWPDIAPPSRALQVLRLVQPRLRYGALVLNDGHEPDYLEHVRGPASTLRTSVLDLGVLSVAL